MIGFKRSFAFAVVCLVISSQAHGSFVYEFIYDGNREYLGLDPDPGTDQAEGTVLAKIEFYDDPAVAPITENSQIGDMTLTPEGNEFFGLHSGPSAVTPCGFTVFDSCVIVSLYEIRDEGGKLTGSVLDGSGLVLGLTTSHAYSWLEDSPFPNDLYYYDLNENMNEYAIFASGVWMRQIPEPSTLAVWSLLCCIGLAWRGIRVANSSSSLSCDAATSVAR